MCAFTIQISSLVKCLFKYFVQFFIGLIISYYYIWDFFIYSGFKFFNFYVIFKWFLQVYCFYFHSLSNIFLRVDVLKFKSNLSVCSFRIHVFCVYLRNLCLTYVYEVFLYIFLYKCIVLSATFRSIIYLNFIFVHGEKEESMFFLVYRYTLFPAPFVDNNLIWNFK